MEGRYILGIDQGSTGTKVIIVDSEGKIAASAHRSVVSIIPRRDWLEHDAEHLWQTVAECITECSKKFDFSRLRAIGITNQRETAILWDRKTGRALSPAISWQCTRSVGITQRWAPLESEIDQRTGLNLHPYYSASKVAWLLENDPALRQRCESGEVCFGNVNSWILFRLTGEHLTDPTNAGRTMLFNVHENCWDKTLLSGMDIPEAILPEVRPCGSFFGMATEPREAFVKPVPVYGMIGDQMSALFGQACFSRGEAKISLGTCLNLVCFTDHFEKRIKGIVPAIAWNGEHGLTYEMEGSTYVAGAINEWLIGQLGIASSPAEVSELASQVPSSEGVYFVPAFRGLGTPYWDDDCRAEITGLSRFHDKRHVCRAALDGVAFQTSDIIRTFAEISVEIRTLKVDGGMAKSDFFMQDLANITGCRIERPANTDRTSMGAVYMAGLASGLWKDKEELREIWGRDRAFEPEDFPQREELLAGWANAVRKSRNL